MKYFIDLSSNKYISTDIKKVYSFSTSNIMNFEATQTEDDRVTISFESNDVIEKINANLQKTFYKGELIEHNFNDIPDSEKYLILRAV